MRLLRLLALVVLATSTLALAAGASTAGTAPGVRVGTAELRPVAAGGPEGVAYARQAGRRVTGWLVVWGLEPGSTHAWHFHGPRGACTPAARNRGVVAGGPDLTADENGVAFLRFRITSDTTVVARGFYVNVHEQSTPGGVGAGITCGNIQAFRVR
jgi:hypothetical protein